MKYVSPKTEQRRARLKRRRKKQMLICVCLLCVILLVTVLAAVLSGDDKPSVPQTTPAPAESADNPEASLEQPADSGEQQPVDSEQGQPASSEENSSQQESGSDKEKPEKPKKPKKSLISRIKSLFAKTEPIPVTFPATVFGKTVEAEMNEIVSLSPLATEVILSSPSQNCLVAVSDYCNKRGQDLMTVGTPLIPDVDKIIELTPDCLIVQTPLSEIDKNKIEQAGIMLFELDYPDSLDSLKEIYRSVTAITQGADIATFESERVAADMSEKLSLYAKTLENENKLNAVMIFNNFGMVATDDTVEGELLRYFFDVKEFGSDYRADSTEALVESNPEVIIAPDTMTEEDIKNLGLGEVNAVANGYVFYVDMQQFEILSPKAIKTLAGIANTVYGDKITPPVFETEETE